MRMPKKLAIIGAGASGIMAAFSALSIASEDIEIWLFEQNERMGKKLLATGNGRCNIHNIHADSVDFFGENPHFAYQVLKAFGFYDFQRFCASIGLFLEIQDDGRVYPLSNDAKSVLITLEEALKKREIRIHFKEKITALRYHNGSFDLICGESSTNKDNPDALCGFGAVILATGSNAAPQLGGGESGYAIARAFGHSIIPLYPSLVQLHLEPILPRLAGIKIKGIASILIDGICANKSQGDLLFTPYGISGFAILDISQSASYALLQGRKVELLLDILPRQNFQELLNYFQEIGKTEDVQCNMYTILSGLVSPKLAQVILKEAGIALHDTPCKLDKKALRKVASILKSWRFCVVQTHGFRHAEVSGGGVSCDEIDPNSMASKYHKGLYFVGEMLDILGARGGYNLAFAWASGRIAGISAVNFLKTK